MDVTISQIRAAIAVADPSWHFNTVFWRTILAGQPSKSFKPLMNRTLAYWVEVFNKWQEKRRERKSCSRDGHFDLSGLDVQKMLFLSKGNIVLIASLFDPDGHRRLKSEGTTASVLGKVKVPMLELIAAGILASQLISTRHKINFLFGLVDCDDSGCLNEEQLANFIKAFVRGVGMMFDVPAEILPRHADSVRVAQRLFERIHRLVAIKGTGKEADKAKDGVRDGISTETMQNWVYGTLSEDDPLALPYRLAIARFCPSRHKDMADEYDETLGDFLLSHSSRVEIPDVPGTPTGVRIFTRAEVILARDLFEYAMELGMMHVGEHTFHKFIKLRGSKIHPMKRDWYLDALTEVVEEMRIIDGNPIKPDFFDYLRKLSPKALPKHLRMYDVWCTEYDEITREEESMMSIDEAASQFVENAKKPFLPADELAMLQKQFRDLDFSKNGLIDVSELAMGWGWSDDYTIRTLKAFDIGCDSMLDEDEFLRMMCPPEYKLPCMGGFARDMFGKLLVEESKSRQSDLERRRSSFLGDANAVPLALPPESVLPPPPDELMEQWCDIFDGLDQDDDDVVHVRDLESSGLLSTAVCYFIAGLIDPSNPDRFDRDAFLNAMCKSHGYARPLVLGE